MCTGRKDSCNVCFPTGSHTQQGEKQSCFPVHALPHLSMLLGLWHRRLRWCPQGCFTGVIFVCGKGKALPSCHVPLYPSHHCHSSQPWMVELRADSLYFSALLGQSSTPIYSPLVSRGMFPFHQHQSSPAKCRAPLFPAQGQR